MSISETACLFSRNYYLSPYFGLFERQDEYNRFENPVRIEYALDRCTVPLLSSWQPTVVLGMNRLALVLTQSVPLRWRLFRGRVRHTFA
jgi:hypothetical protein